MAICQVAFELRSSQLLLDKKFKLRVAKNNRVRFQTKVWLGHKCKIFQESPKSTDLGLQLVSLRASVKAPLSDQSD